MKLVGNCAVAEMLSGSTIACSGRLASVLGNVSVRLGIVSVRLGIVSVRATAPSGEARVRVVAAVVPQGLLLQAVVATVAAASSRSRRGRREGHVLLSLACQRHPPNIFRV